MALQQTDQEVQLQEQDPTFPQLNKQNSILSVSLTLDEFQCKSGKTFGSLNMDEFLASIWSSNDNQITNTQQPAHDQVQFSVPPPICKKTVDQVCSDIHKNKPQQNYIGRNERLKKQQTLEEMTLEDFLIKAGVVQESPFKTTIPFQNQNCNASTSSNSYGLRPAMGTGFSTHCVSSNCLVNATYQMSSQKNNSMEKCQSLAGSSGGCSIRKRIIDGPPEVVVERRQRRMLKNRESAARSRARRQAYTVELEAELNLLKEKNDKLKQILAEAERKRKQEISQRKHSTNTQNGIQKLRAIRRLVSATW